MAAHKLTYLIEASGGLPHGLGSSPFAQEARALRRDVAEAAEATGQHGLSLTAQLASAKAEAGLRLRKYRESLGLTQSEAGDLLGCKRQHVAAIEAGTSAISYADYLKLHRLEIAYVFEHWLNALTLDERGEVLAVLETVPTPVGADRLETLIVAAGADRWREFWNSTGAKVTPLPLPQNAPEALALEIAKAKRAETAHV